MSEEEVLEKVEAVEEPVEVKTFTKEQVEEIVEKRVNRVRGDYKRKYEGIDPEEYRASKAAQEAEEIERQKERGEFEDILKQVNEQKDSKINQLQDRLRDLSVDGALIAAASKGKAINAKQVANLLRGNVRMVEDGSVEVTDESGTPRYDGNGAPLSVDELVDEFLTQNAHFVGPTPSGTGTQSAIGGGTQHQKDVMDMGHEEYKEWRKTNRNQQSRFIKPLSPT